ncbi:TonB-dependent receptor domain-containing protein [Niabella insulamsoli]|uniref:TonB-dependent receptor n=1 Tax=Niabella insulamsoli TaxID=3144874 RepID=UPI0031FDFD5F
MSKLKFVRFSILLAAVLLPGLSGLLAQSQATGVISGRILSADGQPEENVIVMLTPSERQTQSDDNGNFEFRNIAYGNYTLVVKSLGVSADPVTIHLNNERTAIGEIRLRENANMLDRVIVSSSYRHINKNSEQVARLPLTYTENPQNYAVIPKELLYTQLATTTEQALINIPGVSNLSIAGGSGGSTLTFKSRGFNSGSIMYRNGVSTGYVALTDLFNIERIEAIKGPTATLFGGNQGASYGGVYNIITKKPLDVKRGEISFSTGSYELARTTLDYNTPLNEDKTALLRVDAMYDTRNSFQELEQQNLGFAPSLLIKANDRLTLHFDGYYYKSVRPIYLFGFSAPPGGTGTSTYAGNVADLGLDPKNAYFTPDFNSKQQTWSATAQAEYKLSDKWLSQTNYSIARSNNDTRYVSLIANKASTTDTTVITRNILDMPFSQLYTQQFQQNFIGDFLIGHMRNRLLIGLDYFKTSVASARGSIAYDRIQTTASPLQLLMRASRIDSLAANARYTGGGRDQNNSYGAYVSNVLNLTDRLLLMASLRVNRFVAKTADYMQTSYSPKIGLSYQILHNQLSVYANYNNGYNNVAGTDSLGNLLKPEYANQLEGGVKFDVLQHRLTGTVSVYDIRVKNKARAVPGTDYSVQDNEQSSRGVDVDILANPLSGLNIAMGYGYNDIRYSKFNGSNSASIEGNRVESAPYHAANIWGTYQINSGRLKGFGLGAGGNGQSSSFTDAANTILLNGYFVTGASVFYNALKFRVGAKIDNISNKKYYTHNSWLFPGQPRMLTFNVTYRF